MTGMTPEQRLLDLIKSAQTKLKLKKELNIFIKISVILIFLIVAVLAVFFRDFFSFKHKTTAVSVESDLGKQISRVTFYSEENIKENHVLLPEGDISTDKKESPGHLSLLGVVKGNKDQAIIEDRKTNKTLFLYKGDSLGRFKVYDIKDSKVILDYEGDKIELNM